MWAPSSGVQPNYDELSERVGGTFGRLTLFNAAASQRLLIANTQKHMRVEMSGKERQCK